MRGTIRAIAVGLYVATGSSPAQAALFDRGGGLVYDDVLNVTWLQDANFSQSSGYATANFKSDTGAATDDILLDGSMGWDAAYAWATGLGYAGYNDWRLPNLTDLGALGCLSVQSYSGGDCGYNVDTSSGEMAGLYYDALANWAFFDTSGSGPQAGWTGTPNAGPFNIQPGLYWYGTEYASDASRAWQFSFQGGSQAFDLKSTEYFAWAVRDGDVASVPEPATLGLFGVGLAGLGVAARRRSAAAGG